MRTPGGQSQARRWDTKDSRGAQGGVRSVIDFRGDDDIISYLENDFEIANLRK